MSKATMSTEDGVRRLALEHPDWLDVLEAATAVADRVADSGGEFAGAWVVSELAASGRSRWIPNLRLLASYGLVEKSGESTRGGRGAYYKMPDRRNVRLALERMGRGEARRRVLRFVAAGASDGADDTARRAGDLPYEPRSWR